MSQITDTAVNFAGADGDGNCVLVTDGDGLISNYRAALYSEMRGCEEKSEKVTETPMSSLT